MWTSFLILWGTAIPVTGEVAKENPTKHITAIQGEWDVVGMSSNGNASSSSVGNQWRRDSVGHLFRTYVSPGVTLSQLSRLLDKPKWLKNVSIETFLNVQGIPADEIVFLGNGLGEPAFLEPGGRTFRRADETVFVLKVFSEIGIYGDVILLRVSGIHQPESLRRLLAGENCPSMTHAEILELGFMPDSAGFTIPGTVISSLERSSEYREPAFTW